MNAFERFNIKSLSPTMVAQWDSAPATLILRRVFGVKGKANANMWRGEAVEAGMQFYLHNRNHPDAVANAKMLADATFWDRAAGEIREETESCASQLPGMIDQVIEFCHGVSERVMGTQFAVETFLDDVHAPFFGKMDFLFEDKSIIELKTTTRCPSSLDSVSTSHRWQAGIYAKARGVPVRLLYVTPKTFAAFDIEPDDAKLSTLRLSALSMQKALEKCEDGDTLLRSLPLNVDSFYWDDDVRQAYDDALSGKLKALSGPGTTALAAQGYITFGKHAGKHISEVPEKYLGWLLDPKLSDGGRFDVPEDLQIAIQEMRAEAAPVSRGYVL